MFNSIQFPKSILQRAAVASAFEAEAALRQGQKAVSRKGVSPADIAKAHREVKAKQTVARNLSSALRRSN